MYFIDTSALFKRYMPERGSERMDLLFAEYAPKFISTVTIAEILSNLQRCLLVDKVIDDSQFGDMATAMLLDVASGAIQTVGVSAEVIDVASQLLMTKYVTPIDAIQIASAKVLGPSATLVSCDQKVNELASMLRIPYMDPSGHDEEH